MRMFTFADDMFQVFLEEFAKRFEQYRHGMRQLVSGSSDAIRELFRVFHTLKSDSAYFPLEEFSEFTRRSCELLRNFDPTTVNADFVAFLQDTESYLSRYLDWLPERSGEKPVLGDLQNKLLALETHYL
jgi:chemotaxis protein histidine kinase CheA